MTLFTLGTIIAGSAVSITAFNNEYFKSKQSNKTNESSKTNCKRNLSKIDQKVADRTIIIHNLHHRFSSCIRLAMTMRCFEYWPSKCITAIPISKHYLWCALPYLVTHFGRKLNSKSDVHDLYVFGLVSSALSDFASTISSIALLILYRSAAASNPILFTASVILTSIDVLGKINHLDLDNGAETLRITKPKWMQSIPKWIQSTQPKWIQSTQKNIDELAFRLYFHCLIYQLKKNKVLPNG